MERWPIPPAAGPRQRRWVVFAMLYTVYIPKSQKTGKFYVGQTNNLEDRLLRHNSGRSKYTSSGLPWVLVYYETFETRSMAMKRESQIKSYKGGEAFHKLLK